MDASQFSFNQSPENALRRGDRELGANAMLTQVDSLEVIKNKYELELKEKIGTHFLANTNPSSETSVKKVKEIYLFACWG